MGLSTTYQATAVSRLTQLIFASTLPPHEIARACSMPMPRLSEYRLGRRQIPFTHMLNLCEYFQVSPAELLGQVEIPIVNV